MTENVNVVLLNMENGIHEQVTKNRDGSFTVFLNLKDSFETQKQSYKHAMGHVQNDDFQKSNVQDIEFQAHKINH